MRDPFAGSGPTLIAAERTGRTCYAVELEPRYCDIILARWEATGQDKPGRRDT
jgi:DNA modification methylase